MGGSPKIAAEHNGMERRCADCKIIKPLSDFYFRKTSGRTVPYSYCRDCTRDRTRRYKNSHPDSVKASQRRSYLKQKEKPRDYSRGWEYKIRTKYGIDAAEYERLFIESGGVCAICGGDNDGERLCVDHCHDTGTIRGLLCKKCNMGLGNFGDDPGLILRAAQYLKERV